MKRWEMKVDRKFNKFPRLYWFVLGTTVAFSAAMWILNAVLVVLVGTAALGWFGE